LISEESAWCGSLLQAQFINKAVQHFEGNFVTGRLLAQFQLGKDAIPLYGQRFAIALYGQRFAIALYGQRFAIALYGQRFAIALYGQRFAIALYGQR